MIYLRIKALLNEWILILCILKGLIEAGNGVNENNGE